MEISHENRDLVSFQVAEQGTGVLNDRTWRRWHFSSPVLLGQSRRWLVGGSGFLYFLCLMGLPVLLVGQDFGCGPQVSLLMQVLGVFLSRWKHHLKGEGCAGWSELLGTKLPCARDQQLGNEKSLGGGGGAGPCLPPVVYMGYALRVWSTRLHSLRGVPCCSLSSPSLHGVTSLAALPGGPCWLFQLDGTSGSASTNSLTYFWLEICSVPRGRYLREQLFAARPTPCTSCTSPDAHRSFPGVYAVGWNSTVPNHFPPRFEQGY